mmetsp:Transcript_57290/g.147349  ORF Transcript_57290/g.147349 Transcript_57290/m.147349 type:complete len:230 (+) Transcript_57290:1278-1967(+)
MIQRLSKAATGVYTRPAASLAAADVPKANERLPRKAANANRREQIRVLANLRKSQAFTRPSRPWLKSVVPIARRSVHREVATLSVCGTMIRLEHTFWLRFSRSACDRMYAITAEYFAINSSSLMRLPITSLSVSASKSTLSPVFVWTRICATFEDLVRFWSHSPPPASTLSPEDPAAPRPADRRTTPSITAASRLDFSASNGGYSCSACTLWSGRQGRSTFSSRVLERV